MAIGTTPNYTQDISPDGLTAPEFLAVCVTAARALNWDVRYISDAGLIAFTSKTMFKADQKVTIRIADDPATIKSESLGSVMFDLGRNKKNVAQFTAALSEAISGTTPAQLAKVYEELKPQLAPHDDDILSRPPATAKEKWGAFFSLFVPRKGYFVTPILVDVNLAIFVLMAISGGGLIQPGNEILIRWGANIRYLTLDGQWWRIVTCCFIHIGIMHVLLNMYALLYIGILLEPQLGRKRFATAYLLTGVMASLASLYWHPNTLSAGASGAIFGMYGVFLALLTTNLIEKSRRSALLTSIAIFVGYNLLYGASGAVDNVAHIGGLVSGILIGYLYYPGLKHPDSSRPTYSAIVLAAVLVLASSVIAFKKIPNNYGLYERKMRSFARMENRALSVFAMDSDTPRQVWMNRIQDTGIYYWNQCIRVLDEANELEVTDRLKRRDDAMIRYCNLRLLSYHYLYKKFDGKAGAGEDSTAIYNGQIKDLIDSLKNGLADGQ